MSLLLLAQLIHITATVLTVLVVAWAISSWVLALGHPVRDTLDRIVEPLLAPIRRILPPTGPIDLSPMVLILGIALVRQMLVALILGLG